MKSIFKKYSLSRITALACVFSLLSPTASLASAESIPLLFSSPSSGYLKDAKAFMPNIDPQFGEIRELFIADGLSNPSGNTTKPFYFLIQDAHGNLSAQSSIRAIVEQLAQGLSEKPIVLLEGAAGKVDTSLVANLQDEKLKTDVADRLFKNGEIDGIELLSMTARTDLELLGIEEPESYKRNLEAALAVAPSQDRALERLGYIDYAMADLMKTVCSPSLSELLTRITKEREEMRMLPDYLNWLVGKAGISGVSTDSFPELSRLLTIKSDSEMEVFLRNLNHKNLFEEVQNLENGLLIKGAHSTKERTFMRLFKHIKLLEKAVALKLTPIEAQYFIAYADEFQESVFLDYLKKEGRKSVAENLEKSSKGKGLNEVRADDLLPEIIRFYRSAIERDKTMRGRMQRRFKESRADEAIIITGGFHTAGLSSFLREKGFSFAVITPRIEHVSDFGLYRKNLLRFLSVDSETLHLPRLFDTEIGSLLPPERQFYARSFFDRLQQSLKPPASGFGSEAPGDQDEEFPELPIEARSWAEHIRKASIKIGEAKILTPEMEELIEENGEEILGRAVEHLQDAFYGEELKRLQGTLDSYFAKLEQAAKNFRISGVVFEEASKSIQPIEDLAEQAVVEFDYLESALKDSVLGSVWLNVIKSWRPEAKKVLESVKVRWFEFYKSLADHNLRRFSRALRFPQDNPEFLRIVRQIRTEGYPKDAEKQKEIEQFLDLIQVDKDRFLDLVRVMSGDASVDHQIFLRSLLEDSYRFIQKADEYLISAERIVLGTMDIEIETVGEDGEQILVDADFLKTLPQEYQGRSMNLAEIYGRWADEREEFLTDDDAKKEARRARDRSDVVLNAARYHADTYYPLEVTLDMAGKAHSEGRVNNALRHLQEFLHLPSATRLAKEEYVAATFRNGLGHFAAARVLVIHRDRSHYKLGALLDQAIRNELDSEKLSQQEVDRLLDIVSQPDLVERKTGQSSAKASLHKRDLHNLALLGVEKETFLKILDQISRGLSEESGRDPELAVSSANFLDRIRELERIREQFKKGELAERGIKNSFDAFDLLFPVRPILEGNWTPRDEGVAELLTIYYAGSLYWDGKKDGRPLDSGTKKVSKALGHIINRGLLYQRNKYHQLREHMVTMRRVKERIRTDGAIRSLGMDEREMEFLNRLLERALLPSPDPWFSKVESLAHRIDTLKNDWADLKDDEARLAKEMIEEDLLEGLSVLLNEENRIYVERVVFSAFADLEAGGVKSSEEQALLVGARRNIDIILGALHAITGYRKPNVGVEDLKLAQRDPEIEKLVEPLAILNLTRVKNSWESNVLMLKSLAWLKDVYVQAHQYYRTRAHRELRAFEINRTDTEAYQDAKPSLDLASSRLAIAVEISVLGKQIEQDLKELEKTEEGIKHSIPSVKEFDFQALSQELAREHLYQLRLLDYRTDLKPEEMAKYRIDIGKRVLGIYRRIGRLEDANPLETNLRAVDEAFIPFGLRNRAIETLNQLLFDASIKTDLSIVRKAMLRFLILERMGPAAQAIAEQIDGTIQEIHELRARWKQEHVRKKLVEQKERKIQELLKKAEADREIDKLVDKLVDWGYHLVDLTEEIKTKERRLTAQELFQSAPEIAKLVGDKRRASILLLALAHWTEIFTNSKHVATDRELEFVFKHGLFFESRVTHKAIASPVELRERGESHLEHIEELGHELGFFNELMEEGGLYDRAGFGIRDTSTEAVSEKLRTVYSSSAFDGQAVDVTSVSRKLETNLNRLKEMSEAPSVPKVIFTGFESLPDTFEIIDRFLNQRGRWYIAFQGSTEQAKASFKVGFGIERIPEGITFIPYSDLRQMNGLLVPLLRQLTEVERVRYENVLAFFGPSLKPVLRKFSSFAVRLYDAPDAVQEIKWETILALASAGPDHPAIKEFLIKEDGFLRIINIEELADRLLSFKQISVAA